MLKAANTSIENVVKLFNGTGVTYGLLVPTETGYRKSIMDATLSFRSFLMEAGVHRYSEQQLGPAHKVLVPAKFVLPNKCIDTTASLYRPCTKMGDPRLWFSKLTHYCRPTDLLAVVFLERTLYVFNMSNTEVVQSFAMPDSYPYEILKACAQTMSEAADELLSKLREIHAKGFVPGVSHGDTNVGMTLEHLLGIPPNASKKPDYKGIEIKASRRKAPPSRSRPESEQSKKVTLFTNAPDWKRSPFKAIDILKTFGYSGEHDGLQLYCTISNHVNPQGLYLDASDEIDLINKAKSEKHTGEVVRWAIENLKERMLEKHAETFWVGASVDKAQDGRESFRYDFVRHTRRPNVTNMATFFETGIISVDFAMHEKRPGIVRDHGYLFRTTNEKMRHIFPIEREYVL